MRLAAVLTREAPRTARSATDLRSVEDDTKYLGVVVVFEACVDAFAFEGYGPGCLRLAWFGGEIVYEGVDAGFGAT